MSFDLHITSTEGFGSCCSCGKEGMTVRVLCPLPWKTLREFYGTGWGCLVCKLPGDGAIAVVCEECEQKHKGVEYLNEWSWLKEFCAGYVGLQARLPIRDLDRNFSQVHDLKVHAIYERRRRQLMGIAQACRRLRTGE